MYFHTDDNSLVHWLADVMDQAARHERPVRFNVDGNGSLSVKVGQGAWTAPFASTPDPYRDQSQQDRIRQHIEAYGPNPS